MDCKQGNKMEILISGLTEQTFCEVLNLDNVFLIGELKVLLKLKKDASNEQIYRAVRKLMGLS